MTSPLLVLGLLHDRSGVGPSQGVASVLGFAAALALMLEQIAAATYRNA